MVQYKCQRLYSVGNSRHGTNILVVKGTAHTRLEEIRTKVAVIALASFDVGRLKEISRDVFKPLRGFRSVETRRNRIAKCPERLRTRAFASLEGFRMYVHYGRVGAIPTYRVYRLSDTSQNTQLLH